MAWVALVISASLLLLVQAVDYQFSIVENAGDNQLVGQIQVAADTTDFSFGGPSGEHCNLFFTIDDSGSIRTKENIDREAVVQTTGSDVLGCIVAYNTQTETITITILDVNDNVPRFFELQQPQMQTLSENAAPNQEILRLEPVDEDRDQNGATTFEITNGNEAGHFSIQVPLGTDPNSPSRILVLENSLTSGAANTRFNLTVTIRDMGDIPQIFNQLIILDITDLPDEPPTFPVTSVVYNKREDHPVGSQFPFANITASNVDQVHGDIFYSVDTADGNSDFDIGKFISVNNLTGEMYLNQLLDYEDRQQIEFRIVATNPSSNANDNVFVTLNIEDVNDNNPYCINCQFFETVSFVENSIFIIPFIAVQDNDVSSEFRSIQQHVHISSSDSDMLNMFNYTVTKPTISPISSINLTIPPLDREQTPNFTIELTFFNDAEPFLNGSATISVTVLDINDNTPHFLQDSFSLRIAEGAPVGKEVSILQAIDEDEGRNGTITYTLESIDHPSAQDWFHLSPTNGTLSIASSAIDYTAVSGGRVQLNISATDNSDERLAAFAEVIVDISPTLTFSPNSYVEYEHFNIVNSDSYSVYLELRTKRSEGLILFQLGEAGEVVLLELVEGRLRFQHGSSTDETSDLLVSDDRWYSVLLQRRDEVSLQVWETQAETELVEETLFGATLFGCEEVALENPSTAGSLFIGGVNLFSLDDSVRLRATEFVGTIRSVLINSTQIDLGCPTDKVNIMEGFHYSGSNACNTEQCENDHTAGCVDFAPQPYCKCIGGFPPASCQPLPNPDLTIDGSEDSYAPIRFRGDARADLQLDYSFFSDLEAQRRQAANTEVTTNTNTQRSKRAAQLNGTVQVIQISFKLVDVRSSVLLYSKTATTIHILEINGVNEDTHAIIYTATDRSSNMNKIYIPVPLKLKNMTLYNVTVTITKNNAFVSVKENGKDEITRAASWVNNIYAAFVEQPSTVLSIGGSNSENGQGYLEGCIRRVAIDTIEIPLTGLLALSPEDGGFMASTMAPEMYCELCDLTSCLNNSECVRAAIGEPTCACQTGYEIINAQCVPSPTEVPTGGLATTTSNNTTYIIAGSVGAGLLIMAIVLVIVLCRCCKKRERQKRTYSVSNMDIAGSVTSSKPNQYVHMQPRDNNNSIMTTLSGTVNGAPRHDRGSSVSTFQEHAEDGDPEVETPRRFSRRKSTGSAESGIRTDTDQEISLRSIPRMEDSGNEKDTDYSESDSGSDDLSSCFVQSPIGIQLQLVSSANSMTMGSTVSSPHPLTPKERKMIIPLRPPSTALSASEFEDGNHHDDDDTDVEMAYPYSHHTLPSSLSRNSSTRHSGRGRYGSDGGEMSRVESACSGGKWYKASTASDTERERERSRANKAFFTQRSEPGRYPIPPEYLSPPTFEPKTELYPNQRRSRMPISIAESPVSRNSKREAYQFPYEQSRVQDPRVQHPRLQDPRLKYDNHRLRHEYSLPKGHPSVALSSASSSSGRPRHNADAMLASAYPQSPPPIVVPHYPRHFSVSGPGSSIPHHTAHYQYSRSYSSDEKNNYKREPEQQPQFQDLKSVSTINPISYWEMQDRMNKTTVDQVDPYHLLTEPYVQFEDVSTDPSVYESQITQDGPEHQSFCSQGGRERPADIVVPQLSDSELQDDSTIVTETDLGPPMPIFPSADCSSPFTATLVASSSTSGSSTPKTPNVFALVASQHQFDV